MSKRKLLIIICFIAVVALISVPPYYSQYYAGVKSEMSQYHMTFSLFATEISGAYFFEIDDNGVLKTRFVSYDSIHSTIYENDGEIEEEVQLSDRQLRELYKIIMSEDKKSGIVYGPEPYSIWNAVVWYGEEIISWDVYGWAKYTKYDDFVEKIFEYSAIPVEYAEGKLVQPLPPR